MIATAEEDLVARVRAITNGQGARLIFDPVAGKGIQLLAQAAALGGTIFEYGALAMEPTPFPLFTALSKGLLIQGYTVRGILSVPELKAKGEKYVYDHIEALLAFHALGLAFERPAAARFGRAPQIGWRMQLRTADAL